MVFQALFLFGCSSEKDDSSAEFVFSPSNEPSIEPSEPNQSEPATEEDECGWSSVENNTNPLSLVGNFQCGNEVYINYCSLCHMEDGQGGNSGVRLKGFVDSYSQEHLVAVIQNGWGTMPPINVNPKQIADVVVYVKEAFAD